MTEEELLRAAARLGEDQAGQLDSGRISERVVARLASEPAAVHPIRRPAVRWLVGLAAAAGLVLLVRLAVMPSPTSSPPQLSVLYELDGLGTVELEEILETIPVTAAALDPGSDAVPWKDLDSTDLERLLRSLEG